MRREAAIVIMQLAWPDLIGISSRIWRRNCSRVIPFFDYPPVIRKVIYTTNSIESINPSLRKSSKIAVRSLPPALSLHRPAPFKQMHFNACRFCGAHHGL